MKLSSEPIFFSLPAFAVFPTWVYNQNTDKEELIALQFYRQGYLFAWKYGLHQLYYIDKDDGYWGKYIPKKIED